MRSGQAPSEALPCPAHSSYLHCRWADLEELEKDKRIQQKVKRFRAKQSLNSFLTEVRAMELGHSHSLTNY